ncbi:helix-turn-helix domain-containing protein [Streptomyces sp. enrichment culture]|uniref:helix-turn-helix domain-containing protein n=1 Tax=Streptomyces sp. enrichment culture TaxID=1795815 RepID=UPI003F576E2E
MPADLTDDEEWRLQERRRIGRSIKAAREGHNLTQEKVFLAIPLNRAYYQQIEGGQANPSLDVLLDIARAIGVSISTLLQYDP